MWALFWFILSIIFLIIWAGLLIWDNYAYKKRLEREERKRKAKKEAEKKRVREFKWPDNTPHIF